MGKPYQQEKPKSTYKYGDSPPISERFMARAREYAAQGRDNQHWIRAARILWRIEHNLPVGHHKLKRKRARGAEGRAA